MVHKLGELPNPVINLNLTRHVNDDYFAQIIESDLMLVDLK